MTETKTKIYSKTIGRRKSAIASVYLIPGKGEITVNGKSAAEFFPSVQSKVKYLSPFQITGTMEKYAAMVKTTGGGINGQLDAMVLGISRALAGLKKEFHISLRNAGLLTRDSRERQRRMIGTGGKARRKKQSPKR